MHGNPADIAAFLFGARDDDSAPDDGPGPWFEASYEGECSGCFAGIGIGDTIRADGEGGWERQECCGDD